MTHTELEGEFDIGLLVGRTFTSITADDSRADIVFTTEDGYVLEMLHHQDCCEDVELVDICGDISDLVGSPLLIAELVYDDDGFDEDAAKVPKSQGCETWSFYKFATIKGHVTLRWFGTSNGCYSEEATFQVRSGPKETP